MDTTIYIAVLFKRVEMKEDHIVTFEDIEGGDLCPDLKLSFHAKSAEEAANVFDDFTKGNLSEYNDRCSFNGITRYYADFAELDRLSWKEDNEMFPREDFADYIDLIATKSTGKTYRQWEERQ